MGTVDIVNLYTNVVKVLRWCAMQEIISEEFTQHLELVKKTHSKISKEIEISAQLCLDCLSFKKKIILFGNGGSAADAQHIAAELVGRYKLERIGLPAIALTTDTSIITAISNDFGYENVFQRQIEAIANEGDVVFGISTSGNSRNVILGIEAANLKGCKTIGLLGAQGNLLQNQCNVNISVPSQDTARIQEMHILIGHIICQIIDQNIDAI